MSKSKDDIVAFTVRIPVALSEQINLRKTYSRRSRNAEIIHLLETAIDRSVKSDIDLIQSGRKTG